MSLQALRGNVSDHTAYAQMSFIDDPDKEIELMKSEQADMAEATKEINEAMGLDAAGNPKEADNGMQGEGQGQTTEKVNAE